MTWTTTEQNRTDRRISAAELPTNLKAIIELAIQFAKPNRVLLFGSRARGDAKETSDFDIAFETQCDPADWAQFMNAFESSPPSLHKYDLVRIEEVSREFANKIREEGITIYERQ
jgi:predicted nucleotidyltransferase